MNLIERLHEWAEDLDCANVPIVNEAADEIERLTEIADINYRKWQEQVEYTERLTARNALLLDVARAAETITDLDAIKSAYWEDEIKLLEALTALKEHLE